MSYSPTPVPYSQTEIPAYLAREMEKLRNAFSLLGDYEISYKAPDKPQVGMVRYADGTQWNPGATGEGLYVYTSSGWTKL